MSTDEEATAPGFLPGGGIPYARCRTTAGHAGHAVRVFDEVLAEDPVAMIGTTISDGAVELLPHIEREQIPYLSPTPADEQVSPIHDYVFVVPAVTATYAHHTMSYLADNDLTEIAVGFTEGAFEVAGFLSMELDATSYGLQFVHVDRLPSDTEDFGPFIEAVEATDAEVLMFWSFGPNAVEFATQYAASGAEPQLLMTAAQASRLWLEPTGEAAEGLMLPSAVGVVGDHLPDSELRDVITETTTAFEDAYGHRPPQFAMDGASAIMLLAAAIENAGSTNRDAIRDALEQLELTTPNGVYSYSPSDHSGLDLDAIAMNTVRNGEFIPTQWSIDQFGQAYQ